MHTVFHREVQAAWSFHFIVTILVHCVAINVFLVADLLGRVPGVREDRVSRYMTHELLEFASSDIDKTHVEPRK
jgi:uncharacterized membrane protein